jgi:hypothetical protein
MVGRQTGRSVAPDFACRPSALLPLDQQELRHVNVSHGAGSIALLKNDGRITWPASPSGPTFRTSRGRLATQAQEAVGQLHSHGRFESDVVRGFYCEGSARNRRTAIFPSQTDTPKTAA